MVYFEFGRNLARVPGSSLDVQGWAGAVFSSLFGTVENEVDELIQQGERQVNAALSTAAADGSGSNLGLYIAGGIILLVLAMFGLIVIGRSRRQGGAGVDDAQENPLFDQYGVHDEEVSIVSEDEDHEEEAAVMTMENVAEVEEIAEAEPAFTYSSADDAVDAIMDTIDDDDDEEETYTAETVAVADIEETSLEIDEAPAEELTTVSHDEVEEGPVQEQVQFGTLPEMTPAAFSEPENVIHLKDRAEQQAAGDIETEEEPVSPEAVEAPIEEASSVEEVVEPEQEPEEVQTEDSNVRYAFAAAPRSPIAFSGISSGEEPEEPAAQEEPEQPQPAYIEPQAPTNRPYIAPTILREDLDRIGQHQNRRIDDLRDEMTRQINILKSENNTRLDLIINAIDRKLDSLAETTRMNHQEALQQASKAPGPVMPELPGKFASLQATLDSQSQRIRAITQILDDRLDSVSHVYGEVRNLGDRFETFSDKLLELEKSVIDRAQQDVMADVQLSDVVRSCLSPGDYEFKALLSNNNRADCLIRMPHPPGAIVVDTRFPLDAFNLLPGRDEVAAGSPQAKAAEDSFRRSVLRHIIDVAERFIIPGETADSALLFLPTEAIYTALHSRFPDLVRDSFRARVWIVSPSTLMGTLQTLRGVLRDNRERENVENVKREAAETMTEMEALRSRASTLAQNFEQTQTELQSLLEATNKVMSRTSASSKQAAAPEKPADPKPAHSTLMDHLYDSKPEWPSRAKAEETEEKKGVQSPSLYDDKNSRPDNLR